MLKISLIIIIDFFVIWLRYRYWIYEEKGEIYYIREKKRIKIYLIFYSLRYSL